MRLTPPCPQAAPFPPFPPLPTSNTSTACLMSDVSTPATPSLWRLTRATSARDTSAYSAVRSKMGGEGSLARRRLVGRYRSTPRLPLLKDDLLEARVARVCELGQVVVLREVAVLQWGRRERRGAGGQARAKLKTSNVLLFLSAFSLTSRTSASSLSPPHEVHEELLHPSVHLPPHPSSSLPSSRGT